MIDDVTVIRGEHLIGYALALGSVRETLRVLGGHLDLFAQLLVGIGNAGSVAALKLFYDRAGDSAHKADFFSL